MSATKLSPDDPMIYRATLTAAEATRLDLGVSFSGCRRVYMYFSESGPLRGHGRSLYVGGLDVESAAASLALYMRDQPAEVVHLRDHEWCVDGRGRWRLEVLS